LLLLLLSREVVVIASYFSFLFNYTRILEEESS